MSIQRISYEILNLKNPKKDDDFIVQLNVSVKGTVEDKSDCLLMIGEAWMEEMISSGFDPIKAITTMQTQGKMQ